MKEKNVEVSSNIYELLLKFTQWFNYEYPDIDCSRPAVEDIVKKFIEEVF